MKKWSVMFLVLIALCAANLVSSSGVVGCAGCGCSAAKHAHDEGSDKVGLSSVFGEKTEQGAEQVKQIKDAAETGLQIAVPEPTSQSGSVENSGE